MENALNEKKHAIYCSTVVSQIRSNLKINPTLMYMIFGQVIYTEEDRNQEKLLPTSNKSLAGLTGSKSESSYDDDFSLNTY